MRRVALAALLAFAACSGSSDDATRPVPTAVPVSTSEPTTSTAPLESTSTTTAPAGPEPCRTATLRVVQVDGRAALGHGLGIFEVRNAADRPCRVSGYPGVELLDPSGRVVAEGQRRSGAILADRPPGPVTIGAGGAGYFGIEWLNVCEGGDPVAESDRVEVTPPDDTTPTVVAATIPVCAEPSILVSPIRSSLEQVTRA